MYALFRVTEIFLKDIVETGGDFFCNNFNPGMDDKSCPLQSVG